METKGNKKNTDARIKANAKYNSKAYKKIQAYIKPADFDLIDDYARGRGISKAALLVRAVKYCIAHNIDLTEIDGGNDIGAAENIGD